MLDSPLQWFFVGKQRSNYTLGDIEETKNGVDVTLYDHEEHEKFEFRFRR